MRPFVLSDRGRFYVRQCALRGYAQQLAFVGFDDFDLAEMLPTPITVIKHDPTEMGRQGAELLCRSVAYLPGRCLSSGRTDSPACGLGAAYQGRGWPLQFKRLSGAWFEHRVAYGAHEAVLWSAEQSIRALEKAAR